MPALRVPIWLVQPILPETDPLERYSMRLLCAKLCTTQWMLRDIDTKLLFSTDQRLLNPKLQPELEFVEPPKSVLI